MPSTLLLPTYLIFSPYACGPLYNYPPPIYTSLSPLLVPSSPSSVSAFVSLYGPSINPILLCSFNARVLHLIPLLIHYLYIHILQVIITDSHFLISPCCELYNLFFLVSSVVGSWRSHSLLLLVLMLFRVICNTAFTRIPESLISLPKLFRSPYHLTITLSCLLPVVPYIYFYSSF